MSAWTWFFLVGLAVCGLIGRYSVAQGDYPWAAVSFGTAVLLGLFAIYEVSKSWRTSETPAAPAKPRKCGASSGRHGMLFGYVGRVCDLDKGHEGQHHATISRTTENGREVERKWTNW